MRLGSRVTLGLVVGMLAPCTAQGATFEVNNTTDDVDVAIDGRCDTDAATSGRQCSLRAALTETNDRPNADRIEFDPAVFDGTLGDEIDPIGGFLGVGEEVEIDAGDCGAGAFHKPCAGIDAPDGNSALVVGADDVSIRGLAIYGAGAMSSGMRTFGADRLRVRNSWFGRRLNGTSSVNGLGLTLEVSGDGSDDGDRAVIGGKRARDRNVFAGGSNGVFVAGGDRNRILGNLFGVDEFGAALTPTTNPITIAPDTDIDEPAVGNVVGAKLSPAAAASPVCDGGCNAITNGQVGIALRRLDASARATKITGNFIGLRPDGASALENDEEGVWVGTSAGTVIGGGKRERNYITGGRDAWDPDIGSRSLTVKGNLIGFDSTGQTPTDPPDGTGGGGSASHVNSEAAAPSRVVGNRYALAPSTTGLTVLGEHAVVTENTFGLRLDGGALPAPSNTRAIAVAGERAVIGRPGAGNVIGNLSWAGQNMIAISGGSPGVGDRNLIQANRIGIDAGGSPQPITGGGIGISGNADDNRIGGPTPAGENMISNLSQNPITIFAGGESPNGNEVLRNRGSNNGTGSPFHAFVDLLGTTAFGNGDPALHGGIEAPTIDDATRTRVEGSDAEAGAEIWVYRTDDADGAAPRNLKGLLARTSANGSGEWSARFDRIPPGDNLTALQTDAGDGSSELALVAAP